MKFITALITTLLLFWGCSSPKKNTDTKTLTVAGRTADYPEIIQTPEGDIIAWWVETDTTTGEAMVYFSKAGSTDLSFTTAHPIPPSQDASVGAGHIPELVVKPNGTYVLVFARLNEASNARFAGSVFYTQSFDSGKTWTAAQPIPSDTNPDNSHSFPDAILLPNGEVGAVWLDGRHHTTHSAVYFAQTQGNNGFGKDQKIGGPSCQCCKLDLYVDSRGELHLVYRSLTGNNIRDIVHVVSKDSGQTFSAPVLVSDDDWQIGACPHNGPSVVQAKDGLYVAWYTQGGGEGLYFARSQNNGQDFSPRVKLAPQGNHVYLASLGKSVMAIWDEIYRDGPKVYYRIKTSLIKEGKIIKSDYVSPLGVEVSMPFLLELQNGDVLATWVERKEERNQIHYRRFLQN